MDLNPVTAPAAIAKPPLADAPASSGPAQLPPDAETGMKDKDGKKRPSLGAFRALLPFLMRQRVRILAALAALVIASVATLALPMAVRRVIDIGFSDGREELADSYFFVLIAVVAVLALASSVRYYLVMTLGERIVTDLRSAVFRHLTQLDAVFFDTAKAGELVSRLTADTTQIRATFGASASLALRNVVLFIGALVMMVITSPHLSALVIGAIPLVVLPLVFSGRAVRARARAAQDRLADASAYAAEAVGASRTMQAFGAESFTSNRFSQTAEDAYQATRKATVARSVLTGAAIFMVSTSVVLVLWTGTTEVFAGRMTGGRLSQFILYAVFSASSLGQLSEVYTEITAAAGAAERLGELLATEPKVSAPPSPKAVALPVRGDVAFETVSFTYASRDIAALDQVSFRLKPGERVALVGPSGAGKSTVLQLALRFYDPQAGAVTLDGVAAADADPAQWRRHFALVPQDPVIFGASVMDNIRYGRPDATAKEVENAAIQAAADGFIRALPLGYGTLIGERGVTLSGGQRQRLAIARAILKDAPVLLLDEATSALDSESERAVQEALELLMQGRTTLVVAHRLATILSSDRILVMDGGRIVEEGTHAELVRKKGLYAKLARLQFGDEGVPVAAAMPAGLQL
jgi:ATP-binding cassette, subfamily B, bacterial